MPSVGDDVVVLGEVKKEAAASLPVNMNLTLDLNDGIRFSGYGADVTIGGKLTLTAQPGGNVRGVGTVRVIKGRYKAYGQDLDITKGTVSFAYRSTTPTSTSAPNAAFPRRCGRGNIGQPQQPAHYADGKRTDE